MTKTVKKKQTYRELERIAKGFSNHRRIQIMELLRKEPELSIDEISCTFDVNFRMISDHVRRLATAGLVVKRSDGNRVHHKLTKNAKSILKFLRTLE